MLLAGGSRPGTWAIVDINEINVLIVANVQNKTPGG